jgi:hypothetical protein
VSVIVTVAVFVSVSVSVTVGVWVTVPVKVWVNVLVTVFVTVLVSVSVLVAVAEPSKYRPSFACAGSGPPTEAGRSSGSIFPSFCLQAIPGWPGVAQKSDGPNVTLSPFLKLKLALLGVIRVVDLP